LIYGVLSVAGVALASTLCLATHFYNFASSDHLTSPPSLWVYIIWIASFTVGFGLCNLWSFHMHLLRYNYTTKEYFLRKNDAKSNTNVCPPGRTPSTSMMLTPRRQVLMTGVYFTTLLKCLEEMYCSGGVLGWVDPALMAITTKKLKSSGNELLSQQTAVFSPTSHQERYRGYHTKLRVIPLVGGTCRWWKSTGRLLPLQEQHFSGKLDPGGP